MFVTSLAIHSTRINMFLNVGQSFVQLTSSINSILHYNIRLLFILTLKTILFEGGQRPKALPVSRVVYFSVWLWHCICHPELIKSVPGKMFATNSIGTVILRNQRILFKYSKRFFANSEWQPGLYWFHLSPRIRNAPLGTDFYLLLPSE